MYFQLEYIHYAFKAFNTLWIISQLLKRLMCLLPNPSLLSLWFVCLISLMRPGLTPFLTPSRIAALSFEAVGILIEEVGVNGAMASFIPIIPCTAIPIDFEFACVSSAPHRYSILYDYICEEHTS
jgi:hypothetical protein